MVAPSNVTDSLPILFSQNAPPQLPPFYDSTLTHFLVQRLASSKQCLKIDANKKFGGKRICRILQNSEKIGEIQKNRPKCI
jgi:hypothetical protein